MIKYDPERKTQTTGASCLEYTVLVQKQPFKTRNNIASLAPLRETSLVFNDCFCVDFGRGTVLNQHRCQRSQQRKNIGRYSQLVDWWETAEPEPLFFYCVTVLTKIVLIFGVTILDGLNSTCTLRKDCSTSSSAEF